MFFLFFFYCYGYHRDLHSFPTRRSSDLPGVLMTTLSVGFVPYLNMAPFHQGFGPEPLQAEGTTLELDRKSTRLNSSHSSISYAVFCLKKKKRIINITIHRQSLRILFNLI